MHLDVIPGGAIGVEIFFVLSGFLISRLLLHELDVTGQISLRRFYGRRALRLLPALLVVCLFCGIATLAVPALSGLRGNMWSNIPIVLSYFENWYRILTGIRPMLLGQSWSLAVEEQFYIVWPAVLLLLAARLAPRRLVLAMAVLLTLQLCYLADAVSRGWGWWRLYSGTDTDAFALLIGVLLACSERAWLFEQARRSPPMIAWAATCALVAIAALVPSVTVGFVTTFCLLGAVATALLIWALLRGPVVGLTKLLRWRPVQWIGLRSYGIYLWHYPILSAAYVAGVPRIAIVFVGPPLSLLAAAASYRLVEQPFLRRKERLSALPATHQALVLVDE